MFTHPFWLRPQSWTDAEGVERTLGLPGQWQDFRAGWYALWIKGEC